MSDHFIIREARVQDAAGIMSLINELAVYEREPDAVVVALEDFKNYGWGDKPLFKCWVAIAENTVVGMALCYDRYSTWKGPVLYLEDFYVKPTFRKFGIGKSLFENCLDFAQTNHYLKMAWQVLDWNELALDFYRKYKADLDPEWINGSINFY